MRLFDTHCHLNDGRFAEDREAVLSRMEEAGVELAVVVGDASNEEDPVFELARTNGGLYAASGLHPHDADKWSEELARRLEADLVREQAVALGEIGLDYHYDFSPRETQKAVFDMQLEMAYRLSLPAILHIREAHGDATEILGARARRGRLPCCVMHCYSGSWESAKGYLDMGMYISFSGSLTFKNAPRLTEVCRNMPLDRLLVETDCPYMAPVPLRGRRNEPAYVEHTARKAAQIREMDPEELALAALENGLRFFRIPNNS